MRFLLVSTLFILLSLLPLGAAVGVGPGTVTLDYVPGNTEKVDMIVLNNADIANTFGISASVDFIVCEPNALTLEPRTQQHFTCTVTIPKLDLPPGVQEIGRVRVTEVPVAAEGISAVGAVVSIFRVNIPNEGPYLSVGLEMQNIEVGKQALLKVSLTSAGTETATPTGMTVTLVDNTGATLAVVPGPALRSLAPGDRAEYTVPLPTQALKSNLYRVMVDIPYNGQTAHAETYFKVGEMRLAINQFTADPVTAGSIAKMLVEVESFWGELLEFKADVRILKGTAEVGAVREQLASVDPWQQRTLLVYWETGSAEPGTYDAEVTLRYSKKEERRVFPQALTVNAAVAPPPVRAPANWRLPALIVIGSLIAILIVILIIVLRRRRNEPERK